MNLEILVSVMVVLLSQTSLACYRQFSNETRYIGYRSYARSPFQSYIINSTIICSNIYSVSEIFYSYDEAFYNQFLKIKDSNITTLQPNEFAQFSTITKLFLSEIHIQKILPGTFTGLTKLKELYLNDNELTEISKGVYNSLQWLEILDLSNNKIYQIENLALMGISSLEKLHLQNNNLSTIDNNLFDKLNHLTHLDLSGNPLATLSLNGLSHLDTLNLAKTALTQFGEELSNTNLTITFLNLSSSQISEVDFLTFPEVNKLDLSNNKIVTLVNCEQLDSTTVNLTNNQIKSIRCGFKGLTNVFMGHNQLEILNNTFINQSKSLLRLDLSFNNIYTIEKNVFNSLTDLYSLELQHNNLTKLDPTLFRNLTSLVLLNLSYNLIETFQFGTFDSLMELRVLEISYNKLLDLQQYTFNSLSHLQQLFFDHNQISSFQVTDVNIHLPSLKLVSLDGNAWKCKDLVRIDQVLKVINVTMLEGKSYDVENFRGISCKNEQLPQQNVSNISDKDLIENFQRIINESVKNSSLQRFLNEDFMNSEFVKFFQQNYNDSNFVKFLKNYKPAVTSENSVEVIKDKPALAEVKSNQVVSYDGGHVILVFSVFLQVVMCFLLVCIAYFMFSFLKKAKSNRGGGELLSEI